MVPTKIRIGLKDYTYFCAHFFLSRFHTHKVNAIALRQTERHGDYIQTKTETINQLK